MIYIIGVVITYVSLLVEDHYDYEEVDIFKTDLARNIFFIVVGLSSWYGFFMRFDAFKEAWKNLLKINK